MIYQDLPRFTKIYQYVLFFLIINFLGLDNITAQVREHYERGIKIANKDFKVKNRTALDAIRKGRSTIGRSTIATLDFTEFRKHIYDSEILVELPILGRIKIKSPQVKFHNDNDFRFYYQFDDGYLLINHIETQFSGVLYYNGTSYPIRSLLNSHSDLIKLDKDIIAPKRCNVGKEQENPNKKAAATETKAFMANCPTDKIRVLILHDNSVSTSDANYYAQTGVAQYNQTALNSQITQQMVLAGVENLNFQVTDEIDKDAESLSTNYSANFLRDYYNADIVVGLSSLTRLTRPRNDIWQDGGWALEIAASKAKAYALVHTSEAVSYNGFIHEVGHLLGGMHHDDTRAPNYARADNWSKWVWFQNKEYITDIFSSKDASLNRLLNYSNPNINYNNTPTGIANVRDNSRRIRSYAPIVALHESDECLPNANINGSTSASAGDYLNFTVSVSNYVGSRSYAWYVDSGSGFQYRSSSSSFGTTMPSNSGMTVKVVITDSRGKQAVDYHTVSLFIGDPCSWPCTLRLAEIEESLDESELLIYPNPTTDYLFVQSAFGLQKIIIYDTEGKVALIHRPYSGTNYISTSDLISGTYTNASLTKL
jgi:hypothetical protein